MRLVERPTTRDDVKVISCPQQVSVTVDGFEHREDCNVKGYYRNHIDTRCVVCNGVFVIGAVIFVHLVGGGGTVKKYCHNQCYNMAAAPRLATKKSLCLKCKNYLNPHSPMAVHGTSASGKPMWGHVDCKAANAQTQQSAVDIASQALILDEDDKVAANHTLFILAGGEVAAASSSSSSSAAVAEGSGQKRRRGNTSSAIAASQETASTATDLSQGDNSQDN
jgi:hypothetical protein